MRIREARAVQRLLGRPGGRRVTPPWRLGDDGDEHPLRADIHRKRRLSEILGKDGAG